MQANEHIRYEPDERCPAFPMLGMALQGGLLALSNSVTIVTIFAVASGGGASYLAWTVFASLTVGGAVTALQATRAGRLGSGHILLMGPAAPFMAVCVLAVDEGGLPVMSSLIVVASLAQFALAFWLAQLRRIITPVVSGVSLMVISASAMPIAVARLDDVPAGASPLAGPAIGAATLLAAAILMLRSSGIVRVLAIPITILVGCIAGALLGAYDFQRALDAPWFALPEFSAWPGLSLTVGSDFLALLPAFLIVSAVVAVKASNEGAAIQHSSQRRPRAVDFRACRER